MSIEADWVIAAATTGATVVSIVAAFIAKKSASASQDSAQVAAKILHRSAIRELVNECNLLITEEYRIQSLLIEIKSESYFPHNNNPENIFAKDLSDAAEKTKTARSILENQNKLFTASNNDLDLQQGQIQTARADLQTIRESMSRHLETLRIKNLQHQEKIKSR